MVYLCSIKNKYGLFSLRNSITSLQILRRQWRYRAPDFSEIRLGPQKFDLSSDKNGPGSICVATFRQGASQAVEHKTVSEQWFYADGPDVILFLASKDQKLEEGSYYLITPRTKFEIPVGYTFQLYNRSDAAAHFLLVTHPFWPQDKTAQEEVISKKGPWQEDRCEFVAVDVPEDYINNLHAEDPIAQRCHSGYQYAKEAFLSIGHDIRTYKIAGIWSAEEDQAGLRENIKKMDSAEVDKIMSSAQEAHASTVALGCKF